MKVTVSLHLRRAQNSMKRHKNLNHTASCITLSDSTEYEL